MVRFAVYTTALIAVLVVIIVSLPRRSAGAVEAPAVKTIIVEEVKSEGDKDAELITPEQVEAARAMTAERAYSLLSLWALIILAIVLVRLQVRDDERLYEEGYYSRDIE